MAYEVTLPLPPSVNAAFRHTAKTTYKTKQYKNWQKRAWSMLTEFKANHKPIHGKVKAHYTIIQGDQRKRDIANFEKCLSDTLEGIMFKDDSQIDKLIIERQQGTKGSPVVHVRIEEI